MNILNFTKMLKKERNFKDIENILKKGQVKKDVKNCKKVYKSVENSIDSKRISKVALSEIFAYFGKKVTKKVISDYHFDLLRLREGFEMDKIETKILVNNFKSKSEIIKPLLSKKDNLSLNSSQIKKMKKVDLKFFKSIEKKIKVKKGKKGGENPAEKIKKYDIF